MASDRTKAIIESAFDPNESSQRCLATIETVISIMGSEAGNLALKVLAAGGMYVTGGIATHLRPAMKAPRFLQSFRRKGRFAEMMSRIPVQLVVSRAGIAGAAAYGLRSAAPTKADQEVSSLV